MSEYPYQRFRVAGSLNSPAMGFGVTFQGGGGPQQIGNLAVSSRYGEDVSVCLTGGNKSPRGAYGGGLSEWEAV